MDQPLLINHVVQLFARLNVVYMITGSQATIAYGEPRFTNDIDVVADLRIEQLQEFLAPFPNDDFYLSEPAVREAISQRGMFNIIHPESGLKVDVILPKNSPYDRLRLGRARLIPINEQFQARFTTPEDIILKKLEWHQMGGGDRHLRDIAGVIKVQGDGLDRSYINAQANMLGVSGLWQQVVEAVEQGKRA